MTRCAMRREVAEAENITAAIAGGIVIARERRRRIHSQ